MKKDIEWLKGEILKMSYIPEGLDKSNSVISANWVLNYINQLDEPETISQEWIDENKVARIDNVRKMTTSDVVPVEKLKNLLVPKQDKPVIPQFVAEYIEQSKKDNDSINQVFAFIDDKEDKDLWHWLFPSVHEEKRANQEVFMRAWLDGYEVEKEKKYYVYDSTTDSYLGFNGDRTKLGWYYYIVNKESFTEAEIKDYDERYWAFAQEVTQ